MQIRSHSLRTRHFLVKRARPGSLGLVISACLFAVGLFRWTHFLATVGVIVGVIVVVDAGLLWGIRWKIRDDGADRTNDGGQWVS